MVALEGYITTFQIMPASTGEREGLRDLMTGHANVTILTDKGYVGEKFLRKYRSGTSTSLLKSVSTVKKIGQNSCVN